MTDYKLMLNGTIYAQVPIQEFIELLEFKVDALKTARAFDSSWNYGIDELEAQIKWIKENN